MAVEVVEGKAVTVRFDGSRCIHSRRCVMGAPTAFRANVRGAWIDPDSVEAEAVMRVALACPSGAITVERKDGGTPEGPPAANQMQVRENGPLAIHADLEIAGHGRMYRATLCRCGMSKSKPFCDNSHVAAGFVATGEPAAREMALGIPDLTGPVLVEPQPNGPLKITGRMEVASGTGRAVNRIEKAFFCRCGHSANKPYCDGSHKRVGFRSE
ncbi:MAG: CDGSH iron-sulfur domain-containing protein [Rhodovulum sp.]|nr:CDGSH iron-sulfur domain-containing protein [Paracoccaceae bacterium]MCC0066148.1 CDGSH iron-sulfur domain-containing protein [Rhodovulum sp.]